MAEKLSDWAKRNGVKQNTAAGWIRQGIFPHPIERLSPRMTIVHDPSFEGSGTTVYAYKPSDSKEDLEHIVELIVVHVALTMKMEVTEVVSEIGTRDRLKELLADPTRKNIAVIDPTSLDDEGFSLPLVRAALNASGRSIICVDE